MGSKMVRIAAPAALNEAQDYGSAFSRGVKVPCTPGDLILLSGTASIDEHGVTVHVGDFRLQVRRMLHNVTLLLDAAGARWHDVIRTTFYLRDIDRDYAVFNEERTTFYQELGLEPLPASTAIEARLCRPDLLIEMELMAMVRS